MLSPKLLALFLGALSLQAADFPVTRLKTGDITRSVQLRVTPHRDTMRAFSFGVIRTVALLLLCLSGQGALHVKAGDPADP